jgi:hypothetical protein
MRSRVKFSPLTFIALEVFCCACAAFALGCTLGPMLKILGIGVTGVVGARSCWAGEPTV